MDIIYHKKVEQTLLPEDAVAETHLLCLKIADVKSYAEQLIGEITDTSWITKLGPVAIMSYEDIAKKTIQELVRIFKEVDNEITKDFGEFVISLSSGKCLKEKHAHDSLPISELWKEKVKNNHGFDFHTKSPADKFSFGEAKYQKDGNAYTSAAEQTHRFSRDGKDKIDAVHLNNFGYTLAMENLLIDKKGYIVSFSLTSEDHETIMLNSLRNEDIKSLSKICDELYIIGVKI
jgi:hypothetical protein